MWCGYKTALSFNEYEYVYCNLINLGDQNSLRIRRVHCSNWHKMFTFLCMQRTNMYWSLNADDLYKCVQIWLYSYLLSTANSVLCMLFLCKLLFLYVIFIALLLCYTSVKATFLPLPKEVMFSLRSVCLSVCLSVCPSDKWKSCERILMKFLGGVGHGPGTN